jgi:hypothetical protein
MKAKHIDDRIPGEIEQIRAVKEAAWKHARSFVYRGCQGCFEDVLVESDAEDDVTEVDEGDESCGCDVSDFEEDDPVADLEVSILSKSVEGQDEVGLVCETGLLPKQDSMTSNDNEPVSEDPDQVPDQAPGQELFLPKESSPVSQERPSVEMTPQLPRNRVPFLSRKMFLCHSCEEMAAAKELECTICGDWFKALPSHDAYTAAEPSCGQCLVQERWCSLCKKQIELRRLAHYWIDDWNYPEYDDDSEESLCGECRGKSGSDDDSVAS